MHDARERDFDRESLALMRSGIVIRFDRADDVAAARAVLESRPGFVEAERTGALAYLDALSRRPGAGAPVAHDPAASEAVAGPPAAPLAPGAFESLPKEARQAFDDAARSEQDDARGAWRLALPLFEANPRVREIRDLRCRLARARRFRPAVIEGHCSRLTALGAAASAAAAR